MGAPKKRPPPPRDAGNGPSKQSPAIRIELVDLIDIIDELHAIHATSTAAFLVFRSRTFLSSDPSHKAALCQLLENLEEKIAALHERANADLEARRGGGGGAT